MPSGFNSAVGGRDPVWTRTKRWLSPLLNVPSINALRGVPMPDVTGDAAQLAIADAVTRGAVLVARIGETEGRAVAFYLAHRARSLPYPPALAHHVKFGAGYFPTDDAAIDRLARLYQEAIAGIDLYAAWTPHDRQLVPPAARTCRLIDLEPMFTRQRWTLALAGKRVAVVSPLTDSIAAQYARRDALFDAPTLPAFDLVTVRAVQTQCDQDVAGQDWFANLEQLDAEIATTRADVVLIGAGAYGLPLGARAKARGQAAVVLGGATQLLFGIMGSRWMTYASYRALLNPAWIRPAPHERPAGYDKLELTGGAHW